MLSVSHRSSVVSSDAAVCLHSALLGCLEVWLPVEIGQCPSASVCVGADWLPVTQRSCKVTVAQNQFLKSNTRAKKLFSSASSNDQKQVQAGAQLVSL